MINRYFLYISYKNNRLAFYCNKLSVVLFRKDLSACSKLGRLIYTTLCVCNVTEENGDKHDEADHKLSDHLVNAKANTCR